MIGLFNPPTSRLLVAFFTSVLFEVAMKSIVRVFVTRLDAVVREAFQERAGILEFDAGFTREQAEWLAVRYVLEEFPRLKAILVSVLKEGQQ